MVVLPSGTESFSITPITQPISTYYTHFAVESTSNVNDNWDIDHASPPVSGKLRSQPIRIIVEELHLHIPY